MQELELKLSVFGDTTPKEHIEKIKKQVSEELYSKDVRFLMDLIQNAEDNDYAPDVQPSLEFVCTTEDVAGVGAPATLLVFNNEKGFQKQERANTRNRAPPPQSKKTKIIYGTA